MTDEQLIHLLTPVTGAMYPDECLRLYHLAKEATDCIVEVGSWKGKSTCALALGSKDGHGVPVFAIDPHLAMEGVNIGEPWDNYGPQDWKDCYEAWLSCGVSELVFPVGLPAEIVLPGWRDPIGLLWVDAEHTYDATHDQVFGFQRHLTKEAPIALDDRGSPGVAKVIDELLLDGWKREDVGKKVAVCTYET